MSWFSRFFDIRPQANLVDTQGSCVKWIKTAPCSCTPLGEAPDPTCMGCHGTGRVDLDTRFIKGIVTNAVQDRYLMYAGLVEEGDLIFSQYPNECDQLNDYDRIILIDATGGESFAGERIRRGTGNTDNTSFSVQKMISVTQVDPGTGAVTTYVQNTDFMIQGRRLTWIGPHRPATGETYAIQYRAHYEYTVVLPPAIRYSGSTNLGQKVILKLRNIQDKANAVTEQTVEHSSLQFTPTNTPEPDRNTHQD